MLQSIVILIYNGIKIFTLIFGVVLFVSPNKVLNYFIEKELKKLKDNNENINKSVLIENIKKICRIGGVYCVAIILLDKVIRNSGLAVVMGYFIIPIIGLYVLEKKFK